MSIFGDIMSAIFGSSAKAETPAAGTQAPAAKPAAASPSSSPSATSAPSVSAAPSKPAVPAQAVDVAAVLDALAKNSKQKLNWRTSIVDLMKLLELDSGKAARKKLAEELHYTGDTKLGQDECLAAQAGDGQACRKRWQSARLAQGLESSAYLVGDELARAGDRIQGVFWRWSG